MPADAPGGAGASPITFRGLKLFPFQQRAIEAIFGGRSVVVAAPTGAGKTLVADYAIEQALSQDRRVVYTSPIKALSNQKFRDFRDQYGEQRVGLMTGDVTMQPDAPLLIMTTEIFRNTIFEDPKRLDGFDFVIFDEVHFLDDRERGTVWEEAIIYAPRHIRIVGLSATVPNVHEFSAWIEEVRELPVDVIVEEERPVPLVHKIWIPGRGPRSLPEVKSHFIEMTQADRRNSARGGGRGGRGPRKPNRKAQERVMRSAGGDCIDYLIERDLLPAIYFCFSRRDCEALARDHAMRDLLKPDERRKMLELFDDLATRYDVVDAEGIVTLRSLAGRGVLYHHAGMLPIDKEIVERLFSTGLVRLLFATETFALGVNMPARTVCFHALSKFNGISFGPLMGREYWQMAGRAGRQGLDDRGWVYALLDDTSITYDSIEYFHSGKSEPVRSRFNLNYSAILNLFRRVGDEVPDAWEHSFAYFTGEREDKTRHRGKERDKQRGKNKRPGRSERIGNRGGHAIRSRMKMLREHDYIHGDELTRKGLLCAHINGYEVPVTEAYEGGWLFRCDPVEAAMLFASIVYEARPSDVCPRPKRLLKGIRVPFEQHMKAWAQRERDLGLRQLTRPPEFSVAGLVERWAEGATIESILEQTSLAPGDIVRLLRMTIQLLRQTHHALASGDPCIPVLREAQARIDRDVVDARRQLELG
ncbi:MAG: DEAD/DEAH box helicase [Planctomycetota bacterium]|nr:DEAD/DEAH box helicase [Planctomycetota bacterium]